MKKTILFLLSALISTYCYAEFELIGQMPKDIGTQNRTTDANGNYIYLGFDNQKTTPSGSYLWSERSNDILSIKLRDIEFNLIYEQELVMPKEEPEQKISFFLLNTLSGDQSYSCFVCKQVSYADACLYYYNSQGILINKWNIVGTFGGSEPYFYYYNDSIYMVLTRWEDYDDLNNMNTVKDIYRFSGEESNIPLVYKPSFNMIDRKYRIDGSEASRDERMFIENGEIKIIR